MKIVLAVYNPLTLWTLTEESVHALRGCFPQFKFYWVHSEEEFRDAIPDAEVCFGWRMPSSVVERASSLRWFATPSAGMDGLDNDALHQRGIIVTRGTFHGPLIAETAIGLMLYMARKFGVFLAAQAERRWQRKEPFPRMELIHGKNLVIVGAGRIGAAIAEQARAFKMNITGISRNPERAAENFPGIFDRVKSVSHLTGALRTAHHVVVIVPRTPGTDHLIGERELAAMSAESYLYNFGRGNAVDETALRRALESGQIAGAGLDVFDPEPVPMESPLWTTPNLVILPHISAVCPEYLERSAGEFRANLERYASGRALENVVKPGAEY